MIEKVYEINMLYDFYGQMLTDRQKEIIELYYNNDFSLGEISETVNISRQGVYDILKRSEKMLHNYEKKLGLVSKFMKQKSKLKEAYSLLDSMGNSDKIERIRFLLKDIIDTGI